MILTGQRNRTEIRTAALRPVLRGGRWFWPLAALLSLPVLGALGAWSYQLSQGLQVTGLNDQIFWGMYITNLVTFIGFSYGGALVSAILHLTGAGWRAPVTRLAEATALVTLVIGALFIFADLGHVDRIWEFLVTPNGSSPLIWDAIAVSTYLLATLVFLYLPLIPDLAAGRQWAGEELGGWRSRLYRLLSVGWTGLPRQRQVLEWGTTAMAILIIPIAVAVHSVLSWAFALTARDGWHSTIYGPYFVVGALFSGVAMVILVVLAFRRAYNLQAYITPRHVRNLGFIMLVLGLTYLYFTFNELLTEGYLVAEPTQRLLESLLTGPYSTQFWLFVVGGGLLPVLLIALPWTRNTAGIGLAAFLAASGMWLKRFLIVVPPQSVPLIAGAAGTYRPSWVEGLISLGGLAAIPLGLMLFFRLFPVLSIDEMEAGASEGGDVG
jgi:Ni/Fe-hydrogenase subunit HybB-like protein